MPESIDSSADSTETFTVPSVGRYAVIKVFWETRDKLKVLKKDVGFASYNALFNYLAFEHARENFTPGSESGYDIRPSDLATTNCRCNQIALFNPEHRNREGRSQYLDPRSKFLVMRSRF
jgi:hypothetical protein